MDLVPLHAPDAVHEVALVEDQVKVADAPCEIVEGTADNETFATEGGAETVTVVEFIIELPQIKL